MGSKSLLLLLLIVLVVSMALPFAQAQLGGLLGPLLGLLRIQGILYCTPTGSLNATTTATSVFPNALVQLQCGGNVVSSATTDSGGLFSILLDPVSFLVSTLVSGCKLVVNTPLASCNANLPSVGALVSDLQFVGTTLLGLLNIGNLIPTGFQFNAAMH